MDIKGKTNTPEQRSQKLAFCAFFLAAFSCALGLFFCLIKSPQARADSYISHAAQSLEEGHLQQAATAAIEAVRLNPADARAWHMLSSILQQNGDMEAALQAKAIGSKVQQNASAQVPVYAMPAAFKLSLLALAEPSIQ